MAEPWFDANAYGWIPAVISGMAGFSTGMLGERLAPRGKARRPIMTSLYVQIIGSLLLVLAGVVARAAQQEYAVWWSLMLPGLIGLVVVSVTIVRLNRKYRKALNV